MAAGWRRTLRVGGGWARAGAGVRARRVGGRSMLRPYGSPPTIARNVAPPRAHP